MPPAITAILTTHNNPRALQLVLMGYAMQDMRDFVVLIADDGSREETREAIAQSRAMLAGIAPWLRIGHVWQPHRGFYGKPAIVNKAIVRAESDYLILADGDVVPRSDYVRTHWEHKRPGTFLAGGDYRLNDAATKKLTLDDVQTGRAFTRDFLLSIGQHSSKKMVKLTRRGVFTRVLDALNVSPARWSGSNASCWKQMLLEVNGFDESFRGPGKDDTELGQRLRNAGHTSRHVRHNALVLHLEHGQGNYNEERRKANLLLLQDTITTKRTRARIGIDERVHDVVETW
jgi:glycosyltransferase involved in cell wall biosynthesis